MAIYGTLPRCDMTPVPGHRDTIDFQQEVARLQAPL